MATKIKDLKEQATSGLVPMPAPGAQSLIEVEAARAVEEVQAALVIAKKFPRDYNESLARIIEACKRETLAEDALYAYPKGGTTVEGPSIRLAEVLAQNWGNLAFGVRELSQVEGESKVQSFCWDMETNVRSEKAFTVLHARYSREKGMTDLTDPREVYEHVANSAARRLRACVLSIIPGDIVEMAVRQCRATLAAGGGGPIKDRVSDMLKAFQKNFKVSKVMIEKRLGHNIDAIREEELVTLRSIYKSLQDSAAKREDFFEVSTRGRKAKETAGPASEPSEGEGAAEPKTPKEPDIGDATLTYAEISDAINKANTPEGIQTCLAMVAHLPKGQIKELKKQGATRVKELAEKSTSGTAEAGELTLD